MVEYLYKLYLLTILLSTIRRPCRRKAGPAGG